MAKHTCPNTFYGDGAKGGCYIRIHDGYPQKEGAAFLEVGWSCVRVHSQEIPVSWLAELVAIATDHKGGIPGFLKDHDYSGESYAMMCDPPEKWPEYQAKPKRSFGGRF